MQTCKSKFNLLSLAILGMLIFSFSSTGYSQNLTSSSWTSWLRIEQNLCIQRAKVSLRLAKIRLTDSKAWYVVGKAKNLNVRIKCIADENTKNLVSSKTNRMLIDIEVEGFSANIQSLNRLRNCIREFVQSGKSTCWKINPRPSGKFMTIAWTATPFNLRLWGGNGQIYTFYCPPQGRFRPIWGSVTYTDRSSICTAAVHASRLSYSKGGNVRIQLDSGPTFFKGEKSVGVMSREYRGRIRAFNFMNPPNSVNAPVVTMFGKSWNETESGWKGVWVRKGYTNIFSAIWKKGSQTVRATLTMQITANQVSIDRRDSKGGVFCTYSGILSYDRRTAKGSYTCRNSGGVFSVNKPWQATINY